ncbi:MAG: hypothetical protein IT303_04435 [Dehalococcoidia bacterium]|nr:hypothetical protein [Dehalococcoidia bacterium]
MNDVLAGFTAGYALSIIATVLSVYLVMQFTESRFVKRWTEGGVNPLLLSVPLSMGQFFGWTMVGLLLGSVYHVAGLEDEPGALGSPSAPWLIAMVAVAAMPVPLLMIFWARHWWVWVGFAAAFVGLFGWTMPLMAERL